MFSFAVQWRLVLVFTIWVPAAPPSSQADFHDRYRAVCLEETHHKIDFVCSPIMSNLINNLFKENVLTMYLILRFILN